MTKEEVEQNATRIRNILRNHRGWMSLKDIRKGLGDDADEVNVSYCLMKLMIDDKAERKISGHTGQSKFVYRYRSGVVIQ